MLCKFILRFLGRTVGAVHLTTVPGSDDMQSAVIAWLQAARPHDPSPDAEELNVQIPRGIEKQYGEYVLVHLRSANHGAC